jgi:hypothetical protein
MRLSLAALVALCGWSLIGSGTRTGLEKLSADPANPLLDTDDDLLPDAMEWMSLTSPVLPDSNKDGTDDFLATVQYRSPLFAGEPEPLDHEARAITYGVAGPDGRIHVLLSVMMRVVGDAGSIRVLQPFLAKDGMEVPIDTLVFPGTLQIAIRDRGSEGRFVSIQARIAQLNELNAVMPCTIGARILIGTKLVVTGSHLTFVGNHSCAIAPIDGTDFIFQSMVHPQDAGNPFWVDNKACVFQLVQVGASQNMILCEITHPDCKGALTLCCDPQGCRAKEGGIVPLPPGIRLLKGN